ncbi:MAG: M20/M25/M40 family metallo-hydrolase [Corynebacterium variabile]|uniref:M20/M25/M40 family metallo-hydrolase n=3 Tax=Corynebacterium variabile TaxID=1727 RepID=UPI00264792EF|nr:M20/M25/M40 family metallo-hydrolase [Corynebacterium variabile]MDN6844947.1 M20/M25/M40 family metallo-hydrolase [Corynebacterium variabile]
MTLFDDSLTLLQTLVRNACVNDLTPDSGQEVRNADSLEEFFSVEIAAGRDSGAVTVQRLEPRPGRTSIIVTVPGSDPDAEPLTFLGHTDVVPVDAAHWTRDPFGAQIEGSGADARIYGRGTIDMLGLTAPMAVVTREVAREALAGRPPRGTLTFVGVADEEARGGLGAKWLSAEHPEVLDWRNCISETGGSHLPVADGSDAVVVTVGEKGAAQRRLHVTGEPGHGSQPWGRDLTIARIAEVARRIAAIAPAVSQDPLWSGFVTAFRFSPEIQDALVTAPEEDDYLAFTDLARYAHAVSHLTVSPTVLSAGKAINVLPSSAYLELDIRTLPGQTDEDVDAELRRALGDLADEVEFERLICEPAEVSPVDSPLYAAITETVGEFFPDAAVVPVLSAGGTDLRFARRLGGVGYGFALNARERSLADINAELHSHDEHLYLEDLRLTVEAYRSLVARFVG